METNEIGVCEPIDFNGNVVKSFANRGSAISTDRQEGEAGDELPAGAAANARTSKNRKQNTLNIFLKFEIGDCASRAIIYF